ncbi:MAG: zinc-binding dehydrogenase [Bacteroidetes bacterium]|nr:zinc-binding dehydrogenase [Bacteroidota bacterium]
MKAAVIYQQGGLPQYTDFPEPIPQGDEQLLLTVKATAVKHLDKSRAGGNHYTTRGNSQKAKVPGGDGVGLLADGTRVFATGESGMMAEKAIVDKTRMVAVPDGLDDAVAAALPNAVAGSAMALLYRAQLEAGETVLINGATGFTGRMAVQLARYYGAGRVIATGRNEASLQTLKALGADEVIVIKDDESFLQQLRGLHSLTPVNVVLDYLWGHSAELLLQALKGKGAFTQRTRYVSIGAAAGDGMQLSSESLRSTDLLLCGSGLGSWTTQQLQSLFREIIPEMFRLAADKKLVADTVCMPLHDIEKLWDMEAPAGARLVLTI